MSAATAVGSSALSSSTYETSTSKYGSRDDALDPKAFATGRADVVAPALERLDVADFGRRTDLVRHDVGIAGFVAVPNQQDPERLAAFEAFGDHLFVARFKDVQVERRTRKEDGVQREYPQAGGRHLRSG